TVLNIGADIVSHVNMDMGHFISGELRFNVYLETAIPFKVGIVDANNRESWIDFHLEEEKYGFIPNALNQWQEVRIPIQDFFTTESEANSRVVNINSLKSLFSFASGDIEHTSSDYGVAVDNVRWVASAIVGYPTTMDVSQSTITAIDVDETQVVKHV